MEDKTIMDSGKVFDEIQWILRQYTKGIPIKTSSGENIIGVTEKNNTIILITEKESNN